MRSSIALLCMLVLSAPAGAQSLGDVARKERERRDKLGQTEAPSRTVTDEDLASNKGTLANDPRAAPAQTREGEDKEASDRERRPVTDTTPPANGEDYWRGRVAEARGRVEEARQRHDSLQLQIRIGQPAQYDANGGRVMYSLHQMKERADAVEAELRAAETALEDLYQEARRAGALPGWLR